MKKSTLLSLATAGAIVATSVGTFAAWDQMSISGEAVDVTMDKAVTMELTNASFSAPTNRNTLGDSGAIQTATAKVDVKDVPTEAISKYKLEAEATITNNDGSAVENDEVEVTATPTNSSLAGGASDSHDITITVTPKNVNASGKTYKVTLTAKIAENSPE